VLTITNERLKLS